MRMTQFTLAALSLVVCVASGVAYAAHPYGDLQRTYLGLFSLAGGGGALGFGTGALLARGRR